MFLNYIKLTFRSIFANKLFSTVHITGLSIGLAACFIMLIIAIHEYSYNTHNEKLDNIYRVYTHSPIPDADWYGVPLPLRDYINENIPEVDKSARAYRLTLSANSLGEETVFDETSAYCIDEEIFDILTIPMLSKTSEELLPTPNSVLISRTIAEKYFSGKNPIGKIITIKTHYLQNESNFTITGIFDDFPYTSTLKGDYLLPMKYGEKLILKRYSYRKDFSLQSWSYINRLEVVVLKNEKADVTQLTAKLPKYSDFINDPGVEYEYKLQEYSSLHLNEKYANWSQFTVDESSIELFTAISILILIIACFNFIIMSTSRFRGKYKDVGIRKVLGAGNKNISFLIITESIVYALLSLPITFCLVQFFSKTISEFLNIHLADSYFFLPNIIILFLFLTMMIGFVSGLYSVLKLSNLTPLQTIFYRKTARERKLKSTPVFLIVQMIVFIALIFSAIVIKQQIDYFKEGDLGFSKDNILLIEINDLSTNRYKTLQEELKKSSHIKNIGGAFTTPPSLGGGISNISTKNDPSTFISVNGLIMDYDFLKTMKIELKEGRYFSEEYITDSASSIIVNETAAKEIQLSIGDEVIGRQVIGIVKDFKYHSFRVNTPPILMWIGNTKSFTDMAINYMPGTEEEVVKYVQSVWEQFNPNQPLDFSYLDEKFDVVYKSEYNFATLINASSFLSIFIACLGLFGFTVFNTEQRIKEIGIRRVLGASLLNILSIFVKQFLWLIIFASIFGLLAGDYFISQWLNNFVYKIDVIPLYFIVTIVICSIIIISTISIYVIKTTLSNPAEALRYE